MATGSLKVSLSLTGAWQLGEALRRAAARAKEVRVVLDSLVQWHEGT